MARKKADEDDLFGSSAPVAKPTAVTTNLRQQKKNLITGLNAERNFSIITDTPLAAEFAGFTNENDDPGINVSQQLRNAFGGAPGTLRNSQAAQVARLAQVRQGNPNTVSNNENHYQIMSQIHQELEGRTSKIGKGRGAFESAPVRAVQAVATGHLDAATSKLYQHLIKHREGDAEGAAAALEQAGHHLTDAATTLDTYSKGAPKVDKDGNAVFDERGKRVYDPAAKIANPLSATAGAGSNIDLTHIDNKLEGINESYRNLVEKEYGSGVIKSPAASYKIGTHSPYYYLVSGPALDENERNNAVMSSEASAKKAERERLRRSAQEVLKLKKSKSDDPDVDSSLYSEDPDLKKLDEEMPEEDTKFNFTGMPSTLNSRDRRKAQQEAAEKAESERRRKILLSRYAGDYPTRSTSLEDDANARIAEGIKNVRTGQSADVVAGKNFTSKTAAPSVAPNIKKAQQNIATKQAKYKTAQDAAQAEADSKIEPIKYISTSDPHNIIVPTKDLPLFNTHKDRVRNALVSGEAIPEHSARILGQTVVGHLQNLHEERQRQNDGIEDGTLSALGTPGLEDDQAPPTYSNRVRRSDTFHETVKNIRGY